MNTKMLTYLALGGLAGYAISRALSKHPVVEAAEATEKAADAADKAANAAVVAANAAGAIAGQSSHGYGMGRRIQAPMDFWDASRLLGVKKALAVDNALSDETAEFLKSLKIGYDPDTKSKVYLANKSHKAGRPVYRKAPFSVYLGKKNTPEAQQAFLDRVSYEAARVGAEPATDLRSSVSQKDYDAWAESIWGETFTSPYQRFQAKRAKARAKGRPENLAE